MNRILIIEFKYVSQDLKYIRHPRYWAKNPGYFILRQSFTREISAVPFYRLENEGLDGSEKLRKVIEEIMCGSNVMICICLWTQ